MSVSVSSNLTKEQKILEILKTNFNYDYDYDLKVLELRSLLKEISALQKETESDIVSQIRSYVIMIITRIRFLEDSLRNFSEEAKPVRGKIPNFDVDRQYNLISQVKA